MKKRVFAVLVSLFFALPAAAQGKGSYLYFSLGVGHYRDTQTAYEYRPFGPATPGDAMIGGEWVPVKVPVGLRTYQIAYGANIHLKKGLGLETESGFLWPKGCADCGLLPTSFGVSYHVGKRRVQPFAAAGYTPMFSPYGYGVLNHFHWAAGIHARSKRGLGVRAELRQYMNFAERRFTQFRAAATFNF